MKKPRARNLILLLVAGLFLLMVEGYFILRGGLLNDRLVSTGLRFAHRELLGKIEVQAVEGDPLRGLVIRDFTITGADGQLIAYACETVVEFAPLRVLRLQSPVVVRVENAFFHAEKRDGRWNLHRLRRPRPPKLRTGPPRNYPPLVLDAEITNLHLIISPSVERVYDAQVTNLAGRFSTRGRKISYAVSKLSAILDHPRLGINGLTGEGSANTAAGGWDLNFKNVLATTASSVIGLKTGFYQTGVSTIDADFNRLEIAPDVLSVFWPGHSLAIPVVGSGNVTGTTSHPIFAARISSSAGDLNAVGFYDRNRNYVDLKGDLFDFSLAGFLVKPIPLEHMTGGFTLSWERPRPPVVAADPPAGAQPVSHNPDQPTPLPGTTAAPNTLAGGTAAPARIIRINLELIDFAYPGLNSFPGTGSIDLDGDNWALGVSSVMPGTHFNAYVSGNTREPKPLFVLALLHDVNLKRLRQGWPDSKLAGTFKIEGRGQRVETFNGRAEATLDPGMLSGYSISSADLHASISGGRILFKNSEVVGEGLSVRGDGWVEPTRKDVPFSLDVEAAGRDPRLISILTKGAVDAPGASAKLSVSGNRNAWRARGNGTASAIRTKKAETAEASAQIDLAGRGSNLEGNVDFRTSRLTIIGANYKSIKVPPLAVALSAEILSSPMRRPSIRFHLESDSEARDYSMNGAGRLVAGGSSDWRLDLESLNLRVAGRDWALAQPSLIAMDKAGLLIQDFKLGSGRERLVADGRVRRGDLNLVVALDQVDLQPWAQVFQYGDTVGGTMDLSIAVSGSPDAPTLDGAIAVANPIYRSARLDRLAGDLGFSGGRFNFALGGSAKGTGRIEATGFVPMRLSLMPGAFEIKKQDPLEVGIRAGNVDASLIAIILPTLTDIAGRLSVDAKLLGSIQAPLWNGHADVRQVSFLMPSMGLRMEDVNGGADIINNLVTINNLAGRSGEGQASLSGTVQLAAFSVSSLNLAVKTINFRAINTPDMSASMDAELALRGTMTVPKITGKIKFSELTYRPPPLLQYQGTNWEKEDRTIRVKGEDRGEAGQAPWLDRGDLNISIKIPTNTGLIRSAELNLPFSGDLTLKKPPGGFFLIFGRIESREGWLMFQGKPFRVERGNFVFPAIPAIDPDIDILASYRAGTYNTFLKMGGTLSAPTLDIYSEPPLEQADVLSVILFGRPVSELAAGQKETLANTGGQLVASYAATGLGKSLSDALRLDAVVINPGQTFDTSGLGFGKYLNTRLYLFYYHQFGQEAANEFRLRYDVYKNIYVEAGQDRTGQGGADVFFSYPY